MFKKVLNIIVWSLVLIMVGISLGFSIIEQDKAICRDVRVEITDSSKIGFLRSSDIKQWVKKNHGNIFNKKLSIIDLRKIEEGLSKFQSIEKVEVYTSIVSDGNQNEGALVARIKQRKPVFRINSAGRDYYVDKYGKFIDWSPRFTPRVMIVGGIVPGDLARKQLLPLIEYINSDPFFSAQIDQIYVSSRGELSMVPRVGEQRIYFGKPDDFQVKFRNLKALYTDGFSTGGWSKYKSINVEYRNQVICTKK